MQASERLLRAVTESIPGRIAYWTRDLVCGFANSAYGESFGRSPQAMSGISMLDLMGPESLRREQPYIDAVLRGEPQSFERSLIGPDGTVGHTWTHYVPERSGSRVTGFFVLVSDLAQIKRSESLLAESEARLVRAELGTKCGNWELHLDSGTMIGSLGAMRIYGVAQSQFDLPVIQGMVLQEYRAALDKALCRLVADEGGYDIEFKIKAQDTGQIKDIHSVAVFERASGVIFGTIQDITERKRNEQALVESEARFRSIFESTGSIMLLIDAESGDINAANAAAAAYYGFPLNRLVGMNISQFNTLSADEIALERKRALREERNYFNFQHRVASGEIRDTEVYSTPIRVDGRYLLLSIVHDITERRRAQQALLESEVFLQATIDAVSESLCVLDADGRILTVNQAWRDFYDGNSSTSRQANYGVSVNYLDICDSATGPGSDEARTTAEGIRQVIRGERKTFTQEYPCHSPTEQRWFLVRVTRFHGESGHVVVAHENITAYLQNESRLKMAASVFAHAREGIVITDAAASIVEVNKTFTDITGYSREEALGRNPSLLKSGRQPPEFYTAMWRDLHANGGWSGELWNRRKSGEVYAALLTISAVHDVSGKTQNYVALFTDITPIKEHAQQLEHIAHFDALTGLPNRVLLADRLQQAMLQTQRRGQSLAVAYLDLDGFKTVNDRHGHGVGDELLVAISQRMKAVLREGDTLARIGGDEFAAVLVDLECAQDCEPVLNRLLRAAAERVSIGSKPLQVSASIGVTLYPQDAADADQLMRHADQAMYLAKQSGRNRYQMFDVSHHKAVQTRHESAEQIRTAFERQEFVLYYQPKVNMKTGAVIGAEALIRWQHAERGLLPPSAFLPVIEGQPISMQIGEWVIGSAMTQMADWHAAGLALTVSVNVDAYQLQQAQFVPRLAALLGAHPEVRPEWLELEILETSALDDVVQVSRLMHACRDMGVHFALDDFGTGYSPLTYLRRLPAESLKIDQSFVRDMLSDADDLAIVEGVIGLAKAFRRQVIAEGVETVFHGQMLLKLGCELAQGYGIARPMPASELAAWIGTWRPDPSWCGESAALPTPATR